MTNMDAVSELGKGRREREKKNRRDSGLSKERTKM